MRLPLKQKRRFNAVPQIIKYLQFVLSTRIEIHVCFGLVTSNYLNARGAVAVAQWQSARQQKLRSQIRLPSQVIFSASAHVFSLDGKLFVFLSFLHNVLSQYEPFFLYFNYSLLLCVSCAIEVNNGKNLSLFHCTLLKQSKNR